MSKKGRPRSLALQIEVSHTLTYSHTHESLEEQVEVTMADQRMPISLRTKQIPPWNPLPELAHKFTDRRIHHNLFIAAQI